MAPDQTSPAAPSAGGAGAQSPPLSERTGAVSLPSISLPTGGGAIRGIGETFTANPATGTGSMSVPIATSPGRSGFGPQLALSYDSGRGNGEFGFGWSLSLPSVSRRTDRGLPRYDDPGESDVYLLSEAEDLVPVRGEPGSAPPGFRVDRYRPRVEGLFARIERWTRLADGDVHWRSVTRDNITTWYGEDAGSRIADPADPRRVFRWLVCRSFDALGNAMVYEYATEDRVGVDTGQAHERHRTEADRSANRYLKRIRYGNQVSRLVGPSADPLADPGWLFEVVFDYGDHDEQLPVPAPDRPWPVRSDPFSSYRSGFEVRTYRLCRRVLMFHHFPDEPGVGADCLVRSTAFTHQPGGAVGELLTSAVQRGHRRDGDGYLTRSLPPLELSYSPATLHDEVREIDAASLSGAPAGLAGDGYQWVDLDGEGIAGILAAQGAAWHYKPGWGDGRFGPATVVSPVPTTVGTDGARVQLLDLAADGRRDAAVFTGSTPGFFARREQGRGWEEFVAFDTLPAVDWDDPRLRFVDLNGDGHSDLLITEDDAVTWYPSRGKRGFEAARRVSLPAGEDRGPRLVHVDAAGSIQLADMSGDGLADLVRIRNGEVCYWPNLGYGRFGAKVTMDDPPWFDHPERFDPRFLRLADVDGSGITDLIYLGHDGARIYLNRSGNGWARPHLVTTAPRTDNRTHVATVDLFGTGTTCLVWSSDRPDDARRGLRYIDLLDSTHPHLLVSVEETVDSIGKWKDTPFRPHAVARYRHTAYMLKAVMAYLDNLIDWGDALFRQDTGETVNEATQLYVLAAGILGPRPQEVPSKGRQEPQTYASLRGQLDAFSNALTEVEVDLPFDTMTEVPDGSDGAPVAALQSVATALYFCVPRNDKLLGYWDTVADRLFKIRNSLDIHGVFRRLALFDPPIDPALLAKAAAAGLDVGAIVAGLGQPLPLVRFSVLAAKATEVCQQVTSLGAGLLSAIEKQDAEQLAILRAGHERVMLELAEVIRYGQWREAVKAREGLEKTFEAAVARYTYYERLLGTDESEIDVPGLDQLDTDALGRLRLNPREPELSHRAIEVDIEEPTIVDAGGHKISSYEAKELDLLWGAQLSQDVGAALDAVSAIVGVIPQIEGAAKPWGIGVGVSFGGIHLKQVLDAGSAVAKGIAGRLNFEASQAGRIGGYARREQDWTFQRNVIASEITGVYKQWRAAQIREALAEREWRNHQQQIRHAKEVEQFLTDPKTGKTSTVELYTWLRREVRGLYGQCFQFAYDVARQAERALQHELGDPSQSFLQYGYRAGKEGLLAGEKLYLDLKRMELAYHEQNRREYELTAHVSLRQLDPVALLTLRATGACEVTVPEELFDLAAPGHYFRRLKSVALSVPCVVGPYTSVNATLSLQRSSVRTSPALAGGQYARDGDDPERFSDHFGGVQSVVASSGNQDSGLFEVNLRDERYLPFEGSGAISHWRLELPAELPQFDHDTISDVVLHLRYTAREGGAPLRAAAVAHLRERVAQAAAAGSVRLLSVRHEFPTEWARFAAVALDPQTPEAPLTITLREEHYPFWASAVGPIALRGVRLFAEPGPETKPTVTVATAAAGHPGRTEHPLPRDAGLGDLRVGALAEPLPPALGELGWFLDDTSIRDLWLVLSWGSQ